MTLQVFLILVGLVAAGLLGLVLGLRGKRLNDHPVCRWCKFDLAGVYPQSVTCPECGAGLKRDKAVRIGQRRRRPILIAVSGLLASLPLLLIVAALVSVLTGSNLNKYKPLGLLMLEARWSNPEHAGTVAAEIISRETGGTLSADQAAKVQDMALEFQGDASRQWVEGWGDLIEKMRLRGAAPTNDAYDRYLRQAVTLEFKARPRVRAGDSLPVVISIKDSRIGSATNVTSAITLGEARVDGAEWSRDTEQSAWTAWPGMAGTYQINRQLGWAQVFGALNRWGQQSTCNAGVCLKVPADTPLGRHTLVLVVDTRTEGPDFRGDTDWGNGAERPKGPHVREHTCELPIEVVAADSDAVEVVPPTPELTAKFEAALVPSNVMVYPAGAGRQINMTFNTKNPPAPFAFDVLVRAAGAQNPAGTLTSGRGVTPIWSYTGADETRTITAAVGKLTASKVDIVLRPSIKAARDTVDLTQIYGGQVVLKDVEVQNMGGQSQGVSLWNLLFR